MIACAINKDWRITLEEEFRFSDNSNNFYNQHSNIGLTYFGLAKLLDIAINYRHIFAEKVAKKL